MSNNARLRHRAETSGPSWSASHDTTTASPFSCCDVHYPVSSSAAERVKRLAMSDWFGAVFPARGSHPQLLHPASLIGGATIT